MADQAQVKIEKTEMKRCVLFTLSGRFDSNTSKQFEEAMNEATEAGKNNIVLNLSDVDYMSSAALRVLISTVREVRKPLNNGDVRLAVVNERVQHVLELAGLNDLFKSYDSEVEAVGSF